ncbi:hypothetical protein CONLIGDRAFT_640876 [Coniochaeta ligniaria NRRL 30616]|uniref:Rhodopsin domain-containing protein n=1 Tax=Coniochaeta ligniaria NRRL 30616 TaxID=1408157 RepID=A0A1J7K0Y1_9PEZI|nr:hypothetical protein CONLIGDRAFT_640876 [Coniochaeta ligniaria NRRL 30616]
MDYRPLFGDMNASGGVDTNAILTSGQRYPTPTSLQIFAIAIIFVFPALALVVVIIRAAGRIAIRQFGWAMLLSIAETIISYFFIKTNFVGIHVADIPKNQDQTEALIWLYAVQILYNPVLSLVKSSVLIFLLRLFGQKDGVRRFIIGLTVVNILQMVAVFVAVLLQCLPISFNWDLTITNGRCVDRRILYTFTSCFNIVTDLLVLGLPIWIFVDLKIPRRTKVALSFVFLLGFIVTITSVVRLVLLVQGLFGLVTSSDPTFNIGFVVSAIETNLALITASAPALRPFFRARDRGGWLGRSSAAAGPTKSNDVEAATTGTSKPFGWALSSRNSTPRSPGGTKLSRASSRGGRRGGSSSRRGRGGAKKYDIRLRRDVGTELLRSRSPRSSEEETMTANGIMRVSDIQREIDGIVKEIAVEGSGTYTGRAAAGKTYGGSSPPPSRRGDRLAAAAAPRLLTSNLDKINTIGKPASRDSKVNDFRNTGFDFFNRIPPPDTVPSVARGARQQFPPERYYSESVYPDIEYYTTRRDRDDDVEEESDGRDRDYGEERISKYGERRFGVVTPRSGATPTTGNGWRESGRPF